jgi:protocatechuate 3,4-dioxygenase beta subunit
MHTDDHEHDRGLAHDMKVMAALARRRRRTLLWLAGLAGAGMGAGVLLGCGGNGDDAGSTTADNTSSGSSTSSSATSSCSLIPEETAGPYPADGSNGNGSGTVSVLTLADVVRSDIRSSIGGATGTAEGVPLALQLKLVNSSGGCADLSGYAIYLWHCTRDGKYSLYSSGVTNQNYLRGVQQTDGNGTVGFTTIFPGCYSGRMPHIHFEVYRNVNTATSWSNKLRTSQIAFPTDVCSQVYSSASGYGASVSNLAQISFATDNVFSDGVTTQLAEVSGSVASGYIATLTVGISI